MVKVLITGDFCPINSTATFSENGQCENIYNDFLPVLKDADYRITNLECPLYDGNHSADKYGPSLKASTLAVRSLKFAQFDMVTMANNHIMDFGTEGLNSTLKILNENFITTVGIGKTIGEARLPQIIDLKNLKIAIFNFAENEFSNTTGDYPGANPLSLASNFSDIKKYRKHVDKVIVIVHGGNENYELPSPLFKETLRFFADAGADAVIAHHTHRISGYEIYNGAPIFYGLGNFIFDKNRSDLNWTRGIAVKLLISEDSEISFEIVSFSQNRNDTYGVNLLSHKDDAAVQKTMQEFNKIIADDLLLQKSFEKFVSLKTKQYSHFLEPYENRILHGLFGKKIIPSLYSKRKKMLLLNLIRCESHRDVIIKILSK